MMRMKRKAEKRTCNVFFGLAFILIVLREMMRQNANKPQPGQCFSLLLILT